MKVSQLTSNKSFRPVANQFIIESEQGTTFQSYRSVIAFKPTFTLTSKEVKPIQLDPVYSDYSRTTNKYLYQFLNDNRQGIKEGIKTGKYVFVNLN